MKYRSRDEIVYKFLKALSTEKTRLKTHIMYECRLSYVQLKEYTTYLEQNELIKTADSVYSITARGRELLNSMEKVFSVKLTLP